jgi:2-oxoglutarate ferredoxin oxidoreductase subunit beta
MSNNTNLNLNTNQKPTWCPGCGDFGIWTALKQASVKEGWDNTNTALVAGIGCHGHILNYTKISAVEGLHGRALPVACGMKMANHKMNVFAFVGDGDCLSEGGNHFIHSARRNHDITVVLHDNAVYGLTTGQTSPRSPKGYKSKSTPRGSFEEPLHPLTLAITAGATFVARVYAGDIDMLEEIMVKANNHKGFSLIDVLQPCVSFNKDYSHYFYQKNIYHLNANYDAANKLAALEKSMEWDFEQIPVGIIYEDKTSISYEKQISYKDDLPLAFEKITKKDVSKLFESLT